jgi:hypothetical protein
MQPEDKLAPMRDALHATLQSHQRLGKAAPCDCSLCHQIRDALGPQAVQAYRQRLREECALVADWIADQVASQQEGSPEVSVKLAIKTAREIGTRIRLLDKLTM